MRGLATLSSTSATPWGRSVTDSSRFILIMPLLLSAPGRQLLPSQALSLACSPDRTFSHQPRSAGTDRKPPPESRNDSRGSQPNREASNRHPRAEFFESPPR